MKHLLTRLKYLLKGNWFAFKRYDPRGTSGFINLTYKGIPIIERDDCPPNTIYFMNIPEYEIIENSLDWKTITSTKNVSLNKLGEFIKDNPRRFGKIDKIKEVKNEI